MTPGEAIAPGSPMREVLQAFPGAQRALFRHYHIGGCSSCAFSPDETLAQLCARNGGLNVRQVLALLQSSHEQDARTFILPLELDQLRRTNPELRLLDVRSREEFEAVHIEGAVLLSQPVMQEMLSHWPRDRAFVVVDHQGRHGLDAAAYFLGHGFQHVRCLQGGIDAWAQQVDKRMRRYTLG
ncbi:MAG: rhodanese-like domain-containing protein [Verrucomicrobia bacterium]|jgi:rhodanese-related sulfurtransferase|nr:rhodanese-like domain-containing protein [Verrucomicrobiota bacterium]